ncbi:hypothetical protein AWC38_SpisGene9882 [Stylophora pistillata]|uniref:THAP-type domain-containing protein n=1 Tax=Stylophora pistillata TaxID=50429 RepID=A0A2B4SAM1_STYPI|nr:hypothetical protein AWC38_SpisGene9882 [Stylophora pistillata]
MARIPSVITNQGEEIRNLSEERRKKWISAISRKDLTDSILEHGRVCGRHFISGKAAKLCDRYYPGWIPTQNLDHDKCDSVEKLQADLETAAKRDQRARDREMKRIVAENEERLMEEIEAKRQKIGEPGEKVTYISFNSDSAMKVETETGTATQTEQFCYLLHTSTAKPPFDEAYFANGNENDFAYRFGISVANVSRTFSAWMVVLDVRLVPLLK